MSDSSSDEFEEDIGQLKKRPSIKQFPPKNTLIMILDQKINKKRSSSAQVNSSKNFAPRLKPVKAKLCPSPILLNEKSPPKYKQEVQNTTISTSSFDSRNEYKKIRIKKKFILYQILKIMIKKGKTIIQTLIHQKMVIAIKM